PRIRGRLHDLFGRRLFLQVIDEARLPVDLEAAGQLSTTRVAVQEPRAVYSVGERQRKIGRQERLAVPGSGTRNRYQQRLPGGGPVFVNEVEPDATQCLDHLGRLLAAQVRYHAENRQTEVPGDLLRVAHPGVHAIEHD